MEGRRRSCRYCFLRPRRCLGWRCAPSTAPSCGSRRSVTTGAEECRVPIRLRAPEHRRPRYALRNAAALGLGACMGSARPLNDDIARGRLLRLVPYARQRARRRRRVPCLSADVLQSAKLRHFIEAVRAALLRAIDVADSLAGVVAWARGDAGGGLRRRHHKQLRYFVDIADAGSFRPAAERLYIAQSARAGRSRRWKRSCRCRCSSAARASSSDDAGRPLAERDARQILRAPDAAALGAPAQRGIEGTVQLLHSSSVPLSPVLLGAAARALCRPGRGDRGSRRPRRPSTRRSMLSPRAAPTSALRARRCCAIRAWAMRRCSTSRWWCCCLAAHALAGARRRGSPSCAPSPSSRCRTASAADSSQWLNCAAPRASSPRARRCARARVAARAGEGRPRLRSCRPRWPRRRLRGARAAARWRRRSGVLVLWREGGPRHALALRESLQAAFAPSIWISRSPRVAPRHRGGAPRAPRFAFAPTVASAHELFVVPAAPAALHAAAARWPSAPASSRPT